MPLLLWKSLTSTHVAPWCRVTQHISPRLPSFFSTSRWVRTRDLSDRRDPFRSRQNEWLGRGGVIWRLEFFRGFFFLAVETALRPGAPPQTPPLRGASFFFFFPEREGGEEERGRKRRGKQLQRRARAAVPQDPKQLAFAGNLVSEATA